MHDVRAPLVQILLWLSRDYQAGRDVEKASAAASLPSQHGRALLIFAWCCLIFGTVATSAVGPTFLFLERQGVAPLLTITWRAHCSMLMLAPLLAIELLRTPTKDLRNWVARGTLANACAAGASWGVSLCLWVVALQYTTAVRASLFTALAPLVIVAHLFIRGQHVQRGELAGVAVATLGTAVCVLTSSEESSMQGGAERGPFTMLMGDLMCILSACFTAADYVYSARARQSVALVSFTFFSTFLVWLTCGLMSIVFEDSRLLGRSIDALMGWLADEFRWYVCILSLFIGVFGILGYNISLKYISPLLLSIVGLTEPAMTGIITWAAGMEEPPGIGTWVGGTFVLAGTLLAVLFGDH